jgi:uncharacterized iron-regulated membrane protein
MRKLILNIHLYLALAAGIFVTILGITGSIMAFEDDLDRLFNRKLFYSEPRGQQLSPAAILESLQKTYPGQRFNMLRLPNGPSDSYGTQMRGGQIFIDSYTGDIHGIRTGTSVLQTIHQLHLRLLMGKTGDMIVSSVGAIILFLVISGAYLWWPLKRMTVKPGAQARRFSFDLHNSVGIYSAVFLIILSITGMAIGFDDTLVPWLYKVTNSSPPKRNVPSALQPGATPITADDAIRTASAALPGAAPLMVLVPPPGKASYSVAMHFPEDLTPGGRSWVIVDQFSGKASYVENSRNPPAATGFVIQNRAIHTGDIFGYFSKTVMSLTSLMLVVQVITGYYMWWKKLRARQPAPQPAPTATALRPA